MSSCESKCHILVSATALSSGGALTILRQFVASAALSDNQYIIFKGPSVELDNHANIEYVDIDTNSWIKRIWWDAVGVNSFIRKNEINCKLCISLQNTSINVRCAQLIYLHQSLPFSVVWFDFNRQILKFFLYKYFYAFFIFLFTSNETRFVVQTQWMKEALLKNGVKESKISVFTPEVKLPTRYCCNHILDEFKSNGNSHVSVFFYPASAFFYKNHLLVLKALSLLKNKKLINKPVFSVTFKCGAYPAFDRLVNQLDLAGNVVYLGELSYEQVVDNYIYADAVLFPSYIETFGLPLAEAAVLGKKIICSDFPYSRDVLSDYDGVSFLNYKAAQAWADEMELITNSRSKLCYPPLTFTKCATWTDFFKFI